VEILIGVQKTHCLQTLEEDLPHALSSARLRQVVVLGQLLQRVEEVVEVTGREVCAAIVGKLDEEGIQLVGVALRPEVDELHEVRVLDFIDVAHVLEEEDLAADVVHLADDIVVVFVEFQHVDDLFFAQFSGYF
jgi:hypothetical protein